GGCWRVCRRTWAGTTSSAPGTPGGSRADRAELVGALPEAVQLLTAVRVEVADPEAAQDRVDHVEEHGVDRRDPQQREHEQQAERRERLHLALDLVRQPGLDDAVAV